MALLILITTTVFLYAFLRSYGGKGLNIKGEFSSPSTAKGKRERVIAFILVGMVILAFLNMLTSKQWKDDSLTLVLPFLIGATAYIYFYLLKKKSK